MVLITLIFNIWFWKESLADLILVFLNYFFKIVKNGKIMYRDELIEEFKRYDFSEYDQTEQLSR